MATGILCLDHAAGPGLAGGRPAAPSGRKGKGNSGRPEKKEDNMAKPLALLVPLGCARRRACTCGLSTGCSIRGLGGAVLPWTPHPGAGFPLRCFQRLSLPGLATLRLPLAGQQARQRPVRLGPLVLKAAPLGRPAPATDRDRTVSRRSEPSSRTALIGEQPNPWDLLQPQDVMSRHRGAKLSRRCELLGKISLLSPEYLLSVK